MTLRGLIFDADGVVLNTPHHEMWELAAKDVGAPGLTKKEYDMLASGIPKRDGAKRILEYFSLPTDEQTVTTLIDRKQQLNISYIEQKKVHLFGTTIPLILDAKRRGLKIGLASSSDNARRILESIQIPAYMDANRGTPTAELFDDIISGGITPGKPHPKIFIMASRNLNIPYYECIVFEDAISGVEAAKNGGFYCVGIDRTGITAELYEKGADIVVPDLSQISLNDLIVQHSIAVQRERK